MSAAELDEILAVARKHGVQGLALPSGLNVTFFPPDFDPLPTTTDASIPGGWKRSPNLDQE